MFQDIPRRFQVVLRGCKSKGSKNCSEVQRGSQRFQEDRRDSKMFFGCLKVSKEN